MEAWNERNSPPLSLDELETVTDSAYRHPKPYFYKFSAERKQSFFTKKIFKKAEKQLAKGNPFKVINETALLLHAGDEQVIQLEWISALSCFLTNIKINTWQIGKSQSGKSHSKYTVIQLLPLEYYEVFTSASPVSLFYYAKKYGEWSLNEKLLFLDEVQASSDALPMLRSLTGQTDIEPRHLSVHDAKLLDLCIRGKRTVWFTSVQTFGTEQIKNRFIHLNPDESVKQDDRVFQLQDERSRLKIPISMEKLQVAQAMSKLIVEATKKVQVSIPFKIDWPFKNQRYLYPIFLAFIEVICKINFKQRKLDAQGKLTATSKDFQLAKQLWTTFMESIVYRVSATSLKVLNAIPLERAEAITHAELAENLQISTAKIKKRCEELLLEGLVSRQKRSRKEGSGGRAWEYWQAQRTSTDMKISK